MPGLSFRVALRMAVAREGDVWWCVIFFWYEGYKVRQGRILMPEVI